MKLRLSVILFLIYGTHVLTAFGQTNESYYVKYITVATDPNPRFVWDYANKIVSFERASNNKEAACLKKELTKTGLFSNVETQFAKLNGSDDYQFVLTTNYKLSDPVYNVSKIKLEDFKEINKSKFNSLLISEGLINKSLSLRNGFLDFRDKIIEILEKSVTDKTKSDSPKFPWIKFKAKEKNNLEVSISQDFKNCPTR